MENEMMNREKHPNLLPVDASRPDGLDPAAPLRWTSEIPRLIENSEDSDDLKRMSLAADEYAHRKYIAFALSRRDLTPLFEAFPGHPFLKQFSALYRFADDEQRLALLEGVGPTLLECAHWKGWLMHLAVPATNSTINDITPNAAPDATPAASSRSNAWDASKRKKMSQDMKKRSKDLAATHFGVKSGEFWTSAEFAEKAGVADWKLQELQKDGSISFSPLRGPKGYPLLWRKTDVTAFTRKQAQRTARSASHA
jgi:hypothetical protein